MKDKFKEEVLRKIVSNICDGYVDSIISSIEENNTNNFSFTIASQVHYQASRNSCQGYSHHSKYFPGLVSSL